MRDQASQTIGPGRGFAQEKLRNFAHRCRFAAGQMPAPKTVIGGEPFRRVFHHLARQFAGTRPVYGRARKAGLGHDDIVLLPVAWLQGEFRVDASRSEVTAGVGNRRYFAVGRGVGGRLLATLCDSSLPSVERLKPTRPCGSGP